MDKDTKEIYDFCPECKGSFSFRKPDNGECCWCGFRLPLIKIEQRDEERRLVYRFQSLSYGTRMKIASDLNLITDDLEGVRDYKLWSGIFKNAKELNVVAKFIHIINETYLDMTHNEKKKFVKGQEKIYGKSKGGFVRFFSNAKSLKV